MKTNYRVYLQSNTFIFLFHIFFFFFESDTNKFPHKDKNRVNMQ